MALPRELKPSANANTVVVWSERNAVAERLGFVNVKPMSVYGS